MVDTALVLGVEKLFTDDTKKSIRAISSATDIELMGNRGMQFTAMYAMKAREIMRNKGIKIEQIARVAVKNSRNGSLNPIAQYRKPQSVESVISSRLISDPLTLFMCSSIADGAAALVLMSNHKAKQIGVKKPVYVKSCVIRSGEYQTDDDIEPNSVKTAANKAYTEVGIGYNDLDLLEVHDAAASSEIEHLQSLQITSIERGYADLVKG
jgi:acetyl-CoA acyltransferase